jgi:N-acetylglucosaminyldiphosphoundecaprenol N-acetyl-beta-D-mannosaminyltransferase
MGEPGARVIAPVRYDKTRALGVMVDVLTMDQAVGVVVDFVRNAELTPDAPCRIVVTPNLDHAVELRQNERLRAAYEAAALVLADGMPLVWASRLGPRPLPERVTGSDLTPRVLGAAPAGVRVFLLGGSEAAAEAAERNIRSRYPGLTLVGRLSPPRGFEHDAAWSERIVHAITESRAQLVVLGLGAPKQELWAHRHADRLPATVMLCVGATIDFLAGTVSRAPRWMQAIGLEWVYRLLSDPKRLLRRYARDAWHLPRLLWDDLRDR